MPCYISAPESILNWQRNYYLASAMKHITIFWTPILKRVLANHHCLSDCLSICRIDFFLRNGSLVFPHFLRDNRLLECLKTGHALFSKKIDFYPNLNKKGQKWLQIVFFIFWRILSLVFPGNNLKCKLKMLFITYQ